MTGKKIRYLIFFLLGFLLVYIIYDSTSQPTVNDLKGGFKEVASYRNENNTGPITRIYATTVQDTLWQEMEKYGNLMPYTKYGTTTVYFFQEGKPSPTNVTPGSKNFDSKFESNCLAKYFKDENGQISLIKNPF